MFRPILCLAGLFIVVSPCAGQVAQAAGGGKGADVVARHDRAPRKVIIGTTMTPWYGDYPGVGARIDQMGALIDEMAAESRARHGRPPDLVLFSEYALTGGKPGPAAEIAITLDESVLEGLSSKAREHQTHVVFGGVVREGSGSAAYHNSAMILDRKGRLIGRYDKVHPVLNSPTEEAAINLEGGVTPGADYKVFDLDFGRVGIQICYDVEYPEGWRVLAERGAEIVLFPSQSPQLTRPGMYAATHEYWVVSSTFRNNASVFEPGTGLVAAQLREPNRTLVHELDLSYMILPWSSRLRNGDSLREAYGDRVGFRYSESEDRGVFWSNDATMSIGEMTRALNLRETATAQHARARRAQDQARGGPAR